MKLFSYIITIILTALSTYTLYREYVEMKKRIAFNKWQESQKLPGSINISNGGFINSESSLKLIRNIHRAETDKDPIVYCKAVRATLLGLGFGEYWVEGDFREMLEEEFIYKK